MVAVPRTEAQRTAVWGDWAEEAWRMAVQTEGPEAGCENRGVQRTAVQTEGPRGKGRDQLAACRLALSERDFSD